jgi:hypothetical protein
MPGVAADRGENRLDPIGRQVPGQSRIPALGCLGDAQRKVGPRCPAPEQILEEGPQMGRGRLVAIRMLACQQVLDEADSVGGAKTRQVDHRGSKAMIEEPVGEAQHMVDGARAQAPLLDEIGFIVRQQRRSRDLRFGQRHRLRHADVDQMLSELPSEIVEADSAARSSRRRSRQLIRKVGGQCGGRDPASAHQPPQLPREMTVGPDRPRRIVGCGKASRERVQIRIDAGLPIIGHDRGAPCCWSSEDYVGGTPVEHPRHGSTDETGTVLDQASPVK